MISTPWNYSLSDEAWNREHIDIKDNKKRLTNIIEIKLRNAAIQYIIIIIAIIIESKKDSNSSKNCHDDE